MSANPKELCPLCGGSCLVSDKTLENYNALRADAERLDAIRLSSPGWEYLHFSFGEHLEITAYPPDDTEAEIDRNIWYVKRWVRTTEEFVNDLGEWDERTSGEWRYSDPMSFRDALSKVMKEAS